MAKCYLFVLYNKNVKNFAKTSFIVWQKDFSMSFDVTMIYTKQSMPLAVNNSKIAVIGLSLKHGASMHLSSNKSQFSANENPEWTLVII